MLKAKREKVDLILLWCKRKWGKSKLRKDYPKLRVYKFAQGIYNSFRSAYGSYNYETNTINIFLCHHKSYLQLIDTVIHEYKHYMLNSGGKEYLKIEKQLFKKGFSEEYINCNHPHEKKSVRLAKKWSPICFKELKKLLYLHNISK